MYKVRDTFCVWYHFISLTAGPAGPTLPSAPRAPAGPAGPGRPLSPARPRDPYMENPQTKQRWWDPCFYCSTSIFIFIINDGSSVINELTASPGLPLDPRAPSSPCRRRRRWILMLTIVMFKSYRVTCSDWAKSHSYRTRMDISLTVSQSTLRSTSMQN